jgi:hypothetical protein
MTRFGTAWKETYIVKGCAVVQPVISEDQDRVLDRMLRIDGGQDRLPSLSSIGRIHNLHRTVDLYLAKDQDPREDIVRRGALKRIPGAIVDCARVAGADSQGCLCRGYNNVELLVERTETKKYDQ